MKTKKEFREFYLERRSRLSREEVREKSALLFERVCSLEQYKSRYYTGIYVCRK